VVVLKWIVIVLLAVAAVLAIVTALVPQTQIQTRVEVAAPVDVAWRVFADESRMGEWLEGFRSIETLSGEPHAPGSRFRVTFEEEGRDFVMEEEVLTWKENEEYAFNMTSSIIVGQLVIRFEALDDARTAIVADSRTRGVGLFRLPVWLMKAKMIEQERETYGRLAALIESEPDLHPDPESGDFSDADDADH